MKQFPQHTLILRRFCSQKTASDTIKKQLDYILGRGLTGPRSRGWQKSVYKEGQDDPVPVTGGYTWTRKVILKKTSGAFETADDQLKLILEYIEKACTTTSAGGPKYPWQIVEGGPEVAETKVGNTPTTPPEVPLKYSGVNLDRANYFDHIYARDAQIEIILSAVYAAIESSMENRFHCLLWGAAACGKTETLLSLGKMLGSETEAYFKFDCTSLTEAGVKKYLLDAAEKGYIPPVLILEEIEKTEDKMLRWLLGVLDTRGEIRQLNYRVGLRQANVPMLTLATANNYDKFQDVMSGALASRFSHEIYFPRPDREILKRILEREVAKLPDTKENEKRHQWVEATLKFTYDLHNIDDPRKVVPIALCGKDKLLTGEYQNWLRQSRKEFYNKT